MKKADRTSVRGLDFEVKPQKNAAHVEIDDRALIPEEFVQVPEIKFIVDRTKIADALKAGQEVPGARLIQTMRLRIK